MLKIKGLTIETHKGRKLISELSLVLNNGDKLAVIGEEGNGKSTLLKAIADPKSIEDYAVVKGEIVSSGVISYLKQKLDYEEREQTISDYLFCDLESGEFDYSADKVKSINKLLNQFGLTSRADENAVMKTLSGGERVKVQLVKALSNNPDVLLFDEPTNDLDIASLMFLEDFINQSNKAIMYISHDQTLLQNTANSVLHIEQLKRKQEPRHVFKRCGYLEYVEGRQRSLEKQAQIATSQRRERKKQEEILNQQKQKVRDDINQAVRDPNLGRILVKKMRNIKAIERRYENQPLEEFPESEEAIKIIFEHPVSIHKSQRIVDYEGELKIGERTLCPSVDLEIIGAEKVAIIGNNGTGKSTLLKKLYNQLKNSKFKVGYFPQNYSEVLDYSLTPVEALYNKESELNPITLLSSLKFSKEEIEHKIEDLSEGQKAKILILKLIIDKSEILIMDEPTRNLSPLSVPVFIDVLKKFKGVIIASTHDRKFIEQVFDKVYLLTSDSFTKQ